MADGSENPQAPIVPDEGQRSRIGVDEWVASHEERTQGRSALQRRLDLVPRPLLFAAFAAAAACVPFLTTNDYAIRVGFDTLLYMLLALGLNIVVGWAGLLDLGYVAFYGFGAYAYAMLASPKFGIHWPTLGAIPVVVAATMLLGWLVGLPSRRLTGDYLAIVTLFFGQFFVTVMNNGERISVLGFTRGYDVTGGPNGIANIDPFHLFGHQLISVRSSYWLALVTFSVVIAALYLVNSSRTGRAWRSLREDPLAAELMGMPVNRLKLVAFAFGAGVAGLTGTLFASLNTAVFASDFDVPLLITIYAMVILGGAGSLAGVILGSITVNVSLEVLRTPGHATWVFYILVLASLIAKVRPWRWLAGVLAGTIALGFAVHATVGAVWPRGTAAPIQSAGALSGFLKHWVVLPSNPQMIGNYVFVALVLAILALTLLRDRLQKVALAPVLYLGAVVWENRLVEEPSITRLILLGALLIVLMNARPQGIVGTARVEIA
ncbi:MAG: branched-chain amino acid ABC transporter permease [Gaiellaceae bacterium]